MTAIVHPSPLGLASASWLDEPLRELLALTRLPEGWDTYGSPPVDLRAVSSAVLLLVTASATSVPPPRIVPVPGGGVQLEWNLLPRALEVEALPDGSAEYLQVEGDATTEGRLAPHRPEEMAGLLRWLVGR